MKNNRGRVLLSQFISYFCKQKRKITILHL